MNESNPVPVPATLEKGFENDIQKYGIIMHFFSVSKAILESPKSAFVSLSTIKTSELMTAS